MDQANSTATNLNRPLPELPTQSSSHLLLKPSPKRSLHSAPIENIDNRLATHSPTGSKQKFQNLTRELLTPSTPQYSPRTTDKLGLLDPVKYSPVEESEETSKMPSTNNPYHVISKSNPFVDERSNRMEDMYNGAVQRDNDPYYIESSMNLLFNDGKASVPVRPSGSSSQNGVAKSHRKPQGMSQSLSEADLQYRRKYRDPAVYRSPTFDIRELERDGPLLRIDPDSPKRGRPVNRTPSPIKLEDIKEDQPMNFPSSPTKRSRSPVKQLFGENGWLGRSTSMKELPSDEFRKNNGIKHWGGKLKQRVGMMTEDVSKLIHHESPSRKASAPAKTSKFPVSLGPPAQAKLYSEIELMICATANQYLMTQRLENRMSFESIAKITDFWTSKNRPQVIEFMFDQATQRDLVLYNLRTFRFYGANAENPVAMNAMMLSWKALAKEMSVRTFCQPDSVVRKHMHDCYKILEMLGAPLVTFLAFQEIQVKALRTIKEKQQQRELYETMPFGVERRWEPPTSKISSETEEMDDPFL